MPKPPDDETEDALLRLVGLPGPLALARGGLGWERPVLREAAALMAACAPRARDAARHGARVSVAVGALRLDVTPGEAPGWGLPAWEDARGEIRAEMRDRAATPALPLQAQREQL